MLARERFWRAHRGHYYQRLVRMGFGHRNTALLEYAIMLFCGATAIASRNAALPVQAFSLAAAAALLAGIAIWVDRRWAKFERQAGVGT
jgi:UDP-GlcNAc:undecaprenyl-phosphate/decaprenyl-phosphate GlcNAc-1-phosphate transferase